MNSTNDQQQSSSMDWQQARHPSTRRSHIQANFYLQALQKHRNLLEDHLGIWRMVEREAQPGSTILSTAQKCMRNTQSMIEACASITTDNASAEKVQKEGIKGNRKHSSEEPQDQPAMKRAKRAKLDPFDLSEQPKPIPTAPAPPVEDASGLFTIDPNPTELRTLLNDYGRSSWSKKAKRRRSQEEPSVPLGEEIHDGGSGPSATKRAKIEHGKTVDPSAEIVEDYEASFEAKVELRLKQKEQDRQKKAIKKRKRESDGAGGGNGEPAINGGPANQNIATAQQDPSTISSESRQANTKRPRRAAAETARSGIQEELGAATQTSEKRKKAEIIDIEEDNDVTGEKRKKRKPKTRKPKDGAMRQS
ncbi:hypothetical protein PMZ80_001681 [Knufia obscura]|uniref:Uncharacterized protein n=1 Tax=Knufia obscura TaxID=1635080 RepID=A0ABR0S595_9EURO|nr:hypothetical protein PMZ80_001681 [Knufia obscura]